MIIGIEKTFEPEWTRGGRSKAPNLGLLAEAFFERVTVRWTPDKLVMIAEGERYDDKLRKSTKISMEAEDRNWVIIR